MTAILGILMFVSLFCVMPVLLARAWMQSDSGPASRMFLWIWISFPIWILLPLENNDRMLILTMPPVIGLSAFIFAGLSASITIIALGLRDGWWAGQKRIVPAGVAVLYAAWWLWYVAKLVLALPLLLSRK